MAPHVLVKAAFVNNVECDRNNDFIVTESIGTDCILENIFCHLINDDKSFIIPILPNKKEQEVLTKTLNFIEVFKSSQGGQIQHLCSTVEVTIDSIAMMLRGVSNELFSEGITWSRIISLCVFVGELSLQSLSKGHTSDVICVIYQNFNKLVKDDVMPWVEDHGGWEHIPSLSAPPRASQPQEKSKIQKIKGWFTGILVSESCP